ncbi:MAG: carbonic anhydrase [Bacteroidetes bacterium]|nr:carbonic anhydrase [Bacteroidota bacterium]
MISAGEALQLLLEGNERFVAGFRSSSSRPSQRQRDRLVERQNPIAIILGCSDSRVPAEMVFDQGLGDLFVIRVAGNVVAPSQVASVEFAADRFQTRLVVVMGHSSCGAVLATIEELQLPVSSRSPNLHAIVGRIQPSVESLMDTDLKNNADKLLEMAIRANIRSSANHLRHGSPILEDLIQTNGLLVVGAEYSLETGKVDFFDGMP